MRDALIHRRSPESHHSMEGICPKGQPNIETRDKQDKESIHRAGKPDTDCHTTMGGVNGGCSLMQEDDGTQLRQSEPEKAERNVYCGWGMYRPACEVSHKEERKSNKPRGVGLELEASL